jgi:2-succinyl-6-hydroxy-2,4-cyclohexadiene-1-carboxylate synthase
VSSPEPIVLLHGFTNTGAGWGDVIAELDVGAGALAPDIRGHGGATAAKPVSLEAVTADVAAAAPGSFALAGYSMGGRLALHIAVALPGRVTRVVLIGASPGIADAADRAQRRAADEALADEIERLTIDEFAERWARTPVLAGQPAAVRAAVHADRLRSTPAGLAAALRGLGTGALPSLWDRLGELAMPADLIVGERDATFRNTAERMAAALPQATVHVVPGAGHAVHLEAPAAVAEIIAARR